MSIRNIEQFQKVILQDVAIQDKLKEAVDLESFAKLAVQLGRQVGYKFTVEDVKAISTRNRQERTQTPKAVTMPYAPEWAPMPMVQAVSA